MALTQVPNSMLAFDGGPLGMRNRIINGDMRIDQRNAGASVTLTNANFIYGIDRWAGTVSASTSTVTMQRVASGNSSFPYVMRVLRGSGTFTGSAVFLQEIETLNCQDLAGQTVTVSFWARKGSAATNSSLYLQGISGSGIDQGINAAGAGTWTNWAAPAIGNTVLTTTLTQYSYTWAVPAGTNEMALYFVVNTYSGTGSANDYIDITGVQLEAGTVATPFERRLYGQELALCQRYYQYWGGASNSFQIQGYSSASGVLSQTIVYSVTFRTSPTISVGTVSYGNGSGLTFVSTERHGIMYFTNTAGGVASVSASGTNQITFSAEL